LVTTTKSYDLNYIRIGLIFLWYQE